MYNITLQIHWTSFKLFVSKDLNIILSGREHLLEDLREVIRDAEEWLASGVPSQEAAQEVQDLISKAKVILEESEQGGKQV